MSFPDRVHYGSSNPQGMVPIHDSSNKSDSPFDHGSFYARKKIDKFFHYGEVEYGLPCACRKNYPVFDYEDTYSARFSYLSGTVFSVGINTSLFLLGALLLPALPVLLFSDWISRKHIYQNIAEAEINLADVKKAKEGLKDQALTTDKLDEQVTSLEEIASTQKMMLEDISPTVNELDADVHKIGNTVEQTETVVDQCEESIDKSNGEIKLLKRIAEQEAIIANHNAIQKKLTSFLDESVNEKNILAEAYQKKAKELKNTKKIISECEKCSSKIQKS